MTTWIVSMGKIILGEFAEHGIMYGGAMGGCGAKPIGIAAFRGSIPLASTVNCV
jgi:hypothetical protein